MTVLAGATRRDAAGRAVRCDEGLEIEMGVGFEQHLGLRARQHRLGSPRVVMMEPRQREDGCTVAPLGVEEDGSFEGLPHLYLSPDEREAVIEKLMSHRRQAPGEGISGQFDAEEIEAALATLADMVRRHGLDDESLSSQQKDVAERVYAISSEF